MEGKVKAYWMGEMMVGFVRTGRDGRMRPKGAGVDIGGMLRRASCPEEMSTALESGPLW